MPVRMARRRWDQERHDLSPRPQLFRYPAARIEPVSRRGKCCRYRVRSRTFGHGDDLAQSGAFRSRRRVAGKYAAEVARLFRAVALAGHDRSVAASCLCGTRYPHLIEEEVLELFILNGAREALARGFGRSVKPAELLLLVEPAPKLNRDRCRIIDADAGRTFTRDGRGHAVLEPED